MDSLLSRFTRIFNASEGDVVLVECPGDDPEKAPLNSTVLKPGIYKFITARKYHLNAVDCVSGRTIKLYSGDVCFATLTPEDFMKHIKITITKDKTLKKDPATLVHHLTHINALACFYAHNTGRPKDAHNTSRPKDAHN